MENNHEAGLLNGSHWTVTKSMVDDDRSMLLGITPETEGMGMDTAILAHTKPFLGEELNVWEKKDYEQFDFGYAITVHKSQGSQWDNVLLMDESMKFKRNASKWLYTGLTRAAKQIKVVQL